VLSRAIGTCSIPEVQGFRHVVMTEPTAGAAAEAIVDAARSLDALRVAAGLNAMDVASLFSWRRIAQLHVDRYEAAC
jgi:hypothetical protein